MSKVKIVGNASGSGTLTFTGPDTNSDRTITLPDETGTVALGVGIDDNADATAITIDSTENVGFGATPTSFYSGYTGVQVGGNGTLYGQTAAGASNNFWISQNVRAGTDGSEKAITTGVSSQIHLTGGRIEFKVAPSANADANVTWTKVLDIKDDGKGRSEFTIGAWINFNGQGTVAIRDSHNVSSITDSATGDYIVYFDTDFGSANHVGAVDCGMGASPNVATFRLSASGIAAGAYRIAVRATSNQAWVDEDYVTGMWVGPV